MKQDLLSCENCHGVLEPAAVNTSSPQRCPHCGEESHRLAFPAVLQDVPKGVAPQAVADESEAGCFQHPDSRAVASCCISGQFLCALCDIDINGQHFAPDSLEGAIRTGKFEKLQASYTRFDLLALACTCLPFMLCVPALLLALPVGVEPMAIVMLSIIIFSGLIAAPIGLYLAIRNRKSVTLPFPGRRWAFPLARIGGLLQILLWVGAVAVFIGTILE